MSEMKVTVAEIKELMDKMAQTKLGKVSIEEDGFRLTLCSKKDAVYAAVQTEGTAAPGIIQAAVPMPDQEASAESSAVLSGSVVEAPIVGTFYSAPAPDKEPFVTVGKKVNKGDVLFIIESMKLMNEIQSEFEGEVAEILIKDGSPVEFGQPVMIIR